MKWEMVWNKVLKGTLISGAVIIIGALAQGLAKFTPEPGTQTFLWSAFGAIIIGAVNGLLNWLKHKNDPN